MIAPVSLRAARAVPRLTTVPQVVPQYLFSIRQHRRHQSDATKTSQPPLRTLTTDGAPLKLPYHITRTPSMQLPVYQDAKSGGNLHLTLVRKVTGDAQQLAQDLKEALNILDERCWVNPINNHVVMKGWYMDKVKLFLVDRQF